MKSKFAEEAGALFHSSKPNVLLFGHMMSRQFKVTPPPPHPPVYEVLLTVQSNEKQGLAIATALTRGTIHRPPGQPGAGPRSTFLKALVGQRVAHASFIACTRRGLSHKRVLGRRDCFWEGQGSAHSYVFLCFRISGHLIENKTQSNCSGH